MVFPSGQSPVTPGGLRRRDGALQAGFDPWARAFLDQLKSDPGQWHGRQVASGPAPGDEDQGGLVRYERAAQRSLYWCLGHAASSGLQIRRAWSLQVAWAAPRLTLAGRVRLVGARVTPVSQGRRASRRHPERSYIDHPTSRGQLPGESGWRPGGRG
jgi:hypothetical protein